MYCASGLPTRCPWSDAAALPKSLGTTVQPPLYQSPRWTTKSQQRACFAPDRWHTHGEDYQTKRPYFTQCANPLSCLSLTAASSLELRWLGWTTKLNLPNSNADFGSITLFSRCALSFVRRDSAAGAIPDAGYTFEQCAITAANFAHFLAFAGLKQGHCN